MVKKILSLHQDADFVFCAGDDKTDEDMFRSLSQVINPSPRNSRSASYSASPQFPERQRKPSFNLETLTLKNIFTVAVTGSSRFTNAQWRMESSDAVVQLLHDLSQ